MKIRLSSSVPNLSLNDDDQISSARSFQHREISPPLTVDRGRRLSTLTFAEIFETSAFVEEEDWSELPVLASSGESQSSAEDWECTTVVDTALKIRPFTPMVIPPASPPEHEISESGKKTYIGKTTFNLPPACPGLLDSTYITPLLILPRAFNGEFLVSMIVN